MRNREHDKQVQERLGLNEVKIWGHAQEMKQHVKECLAENNQNIRENISEHDYKMKEKIDENDQKMKGSIAKHDHRIKESIAENDQKTKERLDECLKDTEKSMQEQADHILASARHMEQAAHKAVDAHAVVLGDINEQGYFARMTVRTPFCLVWF
jgi:phage-related tail protein